MVIVSRWIAARAARALLAAVSLAMAGAAPAQTAVGASASPASASPAPVPAAPPPRDGAFVHALAWGAKYPPDFAHFDYVDPAAPRGGSLTLDGFGSFDKLNPFTLKGVVAAGVGTLLFDTLTEQSDDEPFSVYGLLAESMSFAPDGLSVTFRLNPKARFANGDPVLAADVKHSFDTLLGKLAHPRFKNLFGDVKTVTTPDSRTVRFEFKRRNHELHMALGSLPVFSRKWGGGKPFDQIVQEPPIASGPYEVERADWGRSISYKRRADYWADGLPVRRGMFNFERVTYKYFKDEVARLEGFKAGQFDWIFENSAKNWARGHTGPKYRSGEIRKEHFKHSNSAGIQGFVMNTRKPLFADRRVRQAMTLLTDRERILKDVYRDLGRIISGPFFIDSPCYDQTIAPWPFDPARA
ncbi:MAG: extracellular solute-binding protein, partial [Burkholderiaceae bacterium]